MKNGIQTDRELGPVISIRIYRCDDFYIETILICFPPAMSLGGPSSSQLDSKHAISTSSKHREDRDQGTVDAAAGPSDVPPTTAAATKPKRKNKNKGSGSATPVPQGERKAAAALEEASFENNCDFIAFGLADDDHREEAKEEISEREWDKGKKKAGGRDAGGGRKRKADFDRNDGYNNKKERTDAASRKAPWVEDVDWEGSTNVAELCVFFVEGLGWVIPDDMLDFIEK